jgi:hypothetical protein
MYDHADEEADRTFTLLVHLLRAIPDNLAKRALAGLFEEASLLEVLARESGAPLDEAALEAATAERWEAVDALRNARAAAFLQFLQRQEF